MNFAQLLASMNKALYDNEAAALSNPVVILDEDGFYHRVAFVIWDEEDVCFYIRTKFEEEEHEAVNLDASSRTIENG